MLIFHISIDIDPIIDGSLKLMLCNLLYSRNVWRRESLQIWRVRDLPAKF